MDSQAPGEITYPHGNRGREATLHGPEGLPPNRSTQVIAYLVGTFPGITETFILREIRSLLERDFEVIVCAVRRSDLPGLERTLLPEGLKVQTIYARPDSVLRHLWANLRAFGSAPARYIGALGIFVGELKWLKPYDIGRILYHFYCGIGFLDTFKRHGVQHLHAHFVAGSNMALVANMYAGYSFSFSAHASGDIYMDAVLLEEKVRRAASVMAVCEYNRRYLDSVTGFRYSDKLLRIYNGVDLKEPEEIGGAARGSEEDQEERRARMVSVGSLVRMKGHATLILACKLLKERGYDFACEVIGEGPERGVLERLIEESGLEAYVRLAGAQALSSVYSALAKADVFVLLSEIDVDGFRDGFPTVILEAMAMSLPVVSTWVSGIPEMVEPGVTGVLVPERDVEAATDAIARLLDQDSLRHAMGCAGRKKLEAQFNATESADLRARVLRKIAES